MGEPIRRMWEIAQLLKEHDVPVRMLRSASPGKVLYEDSFQVVVEEWKHICTCCESPLTDVRGYFSMAVSALAGLAAICSGLGSSVRSQPPPSASMSWTDAVVR